MKIAISGKMGSGKTALAHVLEDQYEFHKFSFADKLKQIVMDLWDIPWENVFGKNKKESRKLMQDFGKKMREIDENVWINYILREVSARDTLTKEYGVKSIFGDNIVIDDVRYKNEYTALKNAGFIMVRMDANSDIRKQRLGEGFSETGHLSETDLDDITDWDLVVQNHTNDLNTLIETANVLYASFKDENR